MKKILVTGSAGFIGSNLVLRLFKELSEGTIVGLDNLNDYYDPSLKEYRLSVIEKAKPAGIEYKFVKGDLADKAMIDKLFAEYKFDVVVNLAAQAGVRYSIENPDAYIQSNMIGFYNILEACRHNPVEHLVYASSSSVYGGNKKVPFSTDDRVDNPVSLYAATKKSNELFAHCYSKLYNIPTTGLRFFTVYGPAGRPDMAYFGFTNKLLRGETIQIFNYGNCRRDFTYVDDIVEGVYRVMQKAPERKNGEDGLPIPPYAVYNIGGGQPENLLDFVQILQEELLRAGVLLRDLRAGKVQHGNEAQQRGRGGHQQSRQSAGVHPEKLVHGTLLSPLVSWFASPGAAVTRDSRSRRPFRSVPASRTLRTSRSAAPSARIARTLCPG